MRDERVTLWALHSSGRMEPMDLEALRRELQLTGHSAPAWQVLGGLMERLDGCPDPQVNGALAWADGELCKAAKAAKAADEGETVAQPPQAVLTAFGVCALFGAYKMVSWLWQLADLVK
jgi:hypothetical protein